MLYCIYVAVGQKRSTVAQIVEVGLALELAPCLPQSFSKVASKTSADWYDRSRVLHSSALQSFCVHALAIYQTKGTAQV